MIRQTLRLQADPESPHSSGLQTAAAILRRGGTVAFATETVYGLGANALDPDAVARIFVAKQRPAWDPLIVHIADASMLPEIVSELSTSARALIDQFWPGPLTLLVPRSARVPDAITAGRPLVGVRMPAHPVARALIREAGVPVAAPSANTFGHVSPTTAAHVAADLDGRIDAILDSGPTLHGLESTVVDTSVNPSLLYRPGAVTLEQLRAAWPATEPYAEPSTSLQRPQSLPSPGLDLRHYAPRARMVLVEGQGSVLADTLGQSLAQAVAQARTAHGAVGLMQPLDFNVKLEKTDRAYSWARWDDLPLLAHRLFAGLRALDEQQVPIIVCPLPTAAGLGAAIRDRLRKAARR